MKLFQILSVTLALSVLAVSTAVEPKPSKYILKEGNTTCIVLKAAIRLLVPYPKINGDQATAIISMPEDATATGQCTQSDQTQRITLHFFNNDTFLAFEFDRGNVTNETDSANSTSLNGYRLKTIELDFTAEESWFPHMAWCSGTFFSSCGQSDSFPEVDADQDYFLCNGTLEYSIGSLAKVELDNLRLKAFAQDDDEGFDGEASVCKSGGGGGGGGGSGGINVHSITFIILIAIGSLVAFGVIALIVACIVVGRSDRRGYQGF